jgi:hypothetical protein
MGAMRTVWMVTSGEYSDYGVDGIFETEQDARTAVGAGFGGSDTDIREIDLYEPGDQPVKHLSWRAYARLSGDGSFQEPRAHSDVVWLPPGETVKSEQSSSSNASRIPRFHRDWPK